MSSLFLPERRRITAVLGPTNTGKTHLAIERMMAHGSGMIGLPLRLLAREVYDRIVRVKGAAAVALITGEEKIQPPHARYFVCTVEAMGERDVDFLAVDEIQLAADRERGHVFTDRLLHARGLHETMMLGSETVRGLIQKLLPDTLFINRPRFSELTWTGPKKLTRLPRRTAIVAFSSDQVYAIAELIRRQRGGAAVVMGALSPRTRNAQVELYQSGDVDFLVATDAIGMGLNMDVDHVAFASTTKFDGRGHRALKVSEMAQIAGRAGRHMNNGTFGVTGDGAPLSDDMIERIENHQFEAEHVLQWRNTELQFSSIAALIASLERTPGRAGLMRAPMADDLEVLTRMNQDGDVIALARTPDAVKKLWQVAQIPDFRKTLVSEHAGLVTRLFRYLMTSKGKIPDDWLGEQVARIDRVDGDIDTLSTRIAYIRTWTYVSHRAEWLNDAAYWQERTRDIEDRLSDALHERLTQRFIDRRTSVLIKRLRQKEDLMAVIDNEGDVTVEGEYVGRLQGFVFLPDPKADGIHGKALRDASSQALALEIAARAARLAAASDADITLSEHGRLLWDNAPVAELKRGDNPLAPRIELLAGEELTGSSRESVQERLQKFLSAHVAATLAPLLALKDAEDVQGLARGIGFRLTENFGSLRREDVADDVKSLDQEARGQLRKHGVRFGAYSIFMPALLKPAPARLLLLLWTLSRADVEDPFAGLPPAPAPGLTSAPADVTAPHGFYAALGFRVCGNRAVRIDMLERLADLIRPVITARTYNGGFIVEPGMMSLVGCSGEEFAGLLKALGYRSQTERLRPKPVLAPTSPIIVVTKTSRSAAGEDPKPAPQEMPGDTPNEAPPTPPAEAPAETPHEDQPAPPLEAPQEAPQEVPVQEPVTPSETPPQASEAGETTSAASEEGELVELEVWRPQRHRKHDNSAPRRRHRQNTPAEGGEAAASGEKPAERRRFRKANKSEGQEARSGEKRHAKHGEERPRGQEGDRRPKHKGDRRDQGRQDRNRDERKTYSAKPPRQNREVDPDSPFAALAVLKERAQNNS